MPFTSETIAITAEERDELEQITRSRTLPAADIFRARLILMLAEGLPYRTMQTRLDTTAATICRWKERFIKGRVAGLKEVRHALEQAVRHYPGTYGESNRCDPASAERWIDPLVLQETGAKPRYRQRQRAAHLAGGRVEASPAAALHGLGRS